MWATATRRESWENSAFTNTGESGGTFSVESVGVARFLAITTMNLNQLANELNIATRRQSTTVGVPMIYSTSYIDMNFVHAAEIAGSVSAPHVQQLAIITQH